MAEIRSPDTRERILDTAEQLFMNHGFDGLVAFWSRSIRSAWSVMSFDRW